VTLCIVECSVNGRQSSTTGSNKQSNFIHATPSVNVYQTEYNATQIHQTQMPVFPDSSGLIYQNLPSYQQMHRFSENPVYVPGFLGYPMQDPQSDSANRKSKQVVGSLVHKKPSVLGEVKRLASKDESSESDDESSESDKEGSESDDDEETTPVENKNCKVMSESSRIYRGKEIMTDMKASKEELFWKACKAYRISEFEERFSILRNWLPSVANKLDMIGLEKWARVHFPDEHKHELTPWAEAKLAKRIAKASTWTTSVWRASYKEIIYDVGHPSEWEQPDGLITVLPPLMDKRPPGRPRNRDRFRSMGEQIKQKSCTRCFRGGHNRRDFPSMVSSHIFIPTTSSVKSSSSTSMKVSKRSSWNEEI
nr:hypothetical protein [Tanacetum cinerariifolium]